MKRDRNPHDGNGFNDLMDLVRRDNSPEPLVMLARTHHSSFREFPFPGYLAPGASSVSPRISLSLSCLYSLIVNVRGEEAIIIDKINTKTS
jgi:hypothetical protein